MKLVGLTEIAEILGVSRQRVRQLVIAYDDFPSPVAELAAGRVWDSSEVEAWIIDHPVRTAGKQSVPDADLGKLLRLQLKSHLPKGGSMFERFTDEARRAVVLAQERAREFGHGYTGTEHLLLGVFDADGIAQDVLRAAGLTSVELAEDIVEAIGRGPGSTTGSLPFTPSAKKMLELSLQEARLMGPPFVATEHLLLGLLRTDSVGFRILNNRIPAAQIRERVLEAFPAGDEPAVSARVRLGPSVQEVAARFNGPQGSLEARLSSLEDAVRALIERLDRDKPT